MNNNSKSKSKAHVRLDSRSEARKNKSFLFFCAGESTANGTAPTCFFVSRVSVNISLSHHHLYLSIYNLSKYLSKYLSKKYILIIVLVIIIRSF